MAPSAITNTLSSLQRDSNTSRGLSGPSNPLKRPYTPSISDDTPHSGPTIGHAADKDNGPGDDRRLGLLRDLYDRSERMLVGLFARESEGLDRRKSKPQLQSKAAKDVSQSAKPTNTPRRPARIIDEDDYGDYHEKDVSQPAKPTNTPRRPARIIDEDDYGDDDDDDEEEAETTLQSPLQAKSGPPLKSQPPPLSTPATSKPSHDRSPPATDQAKSAEEIRKKLENEKKAAEDAAKESFQNMFYTLENDRDAMLEQQKLDELDRQVETEMSAQGNSGSGAGPNGSSQQGTLSSTNLGASSLTLKHLISRIDSKRSQVKATDSQLRSLMSEVRKNRSKWANEEKVGQEELYEAAERVLMELKAMTDAATPFLQKVNKRDAPDYHLIIKHPMDIGTMMKKLKTLQYKSRKEFVDDLELIWSNCLKYNAEPNHFLRKKAEYMKKETARLTPLIPDITIRDRAEVEAEERRLQQDFDEGEESDEEPIITSRGRMAPGKTSSKGTSSSRKAPPVVNESTPGPEAKPQPLTASALDPLSHLKNDHLRSDADSVTDGSHLGGLSTPPPGNATPVGPNGIPGSAAPGSHADPSELDVIMGQADEPDVGDEEYQSWKQITKKERAHFATQRHRLFKGDKINPEEPALLRTRAKMRRWMRLQKSLPERASEENASTEQEKQLTQDEQGSTLAEGMDDGEDQSLLPDYYDPLAAIPHLEERLAWKEDNEGFVIDPKEECLRILPEGYFTSPRSAFTAKMESNMRQMQETRKVVSKINIIKQMQVQAQTYQNQFQKYDPQPFVEADVGPVVVSDDGPFIAPTVTRAALQRSVGKIFYQAGFEEFQPSALDAVTEMAGDYFKRLVETMNVYRNCPQVYCDVPVETSTDAAVPTTGRPTESAETKRVLKPRFTFEQIMLHTLHEAGTDLDSLESYVREDVDRLASKLETHHGRTKDYYADLLRPALDPTSVGNDGVGAFKDGSEQFVGGDFAEDIGEDFFGFRALGLDKEFGIPNLSVPLHLLQSRVYNAHQPADAGQKDGEVIRMAELPPYPPVTVESVEDQIDIVKDWFRNKLEAKNNEPLIEDDDLPAKQRFPKPRLPPNGKISSPRKRPIREQQMMARKKRRLEIEAEREREREREQATTDAAAVEAQNATNATENPSIESNAAPQVNGVPAESNTATQEQSEQTQQSEQTSNDTTQGSVVVNGDGVHEDKDKDTASSNTTASANEKPATKSAEQLKLDLKKTPHLSQPDQTDSSSANAGDPEKNQDEEDDNLANGILSPNNVPIATH